MFPLPLKYLLKSLILSPMPSSQLVRVTSPPGCGRRRRAPSPQIGIARRHRLPWSGTWVSRVLSATICCLFPLLAGCEKMSNEIIRVIETGTMGWSHAAGAQLQKIDEIRKAATDDGSAAIIDVLDTFDDDLRNRLEQVRDMQGDAVRDADELLRRSDELLSNIPGAARIPVYWEVAPSYYTHQHLSRPGDLTILLTGLRMHHGAPSLSFGSSQECSRDQATPSSLVFTCSKDYFRSPEISGPISFTARLSLYERQSAWKPFSRQIRHDYEVPVRFVSSVLGRAIVETSRRSIVTVETRTRTATFDVRGKLDDPTWVPARGPFVPLRGYEIVPDTIKIVGYRRRGTQHPHVKVSLQSEFSFFVECLMHRVERKGILPFLTGPLVVDGPAWCNGRVEWTEARKEEGFGAQEVGKWEELTWGSDLTFDLCGDLSGTSTPVTPGFGGGDRAVRYAAGGDSGTPNETSRGDCVPPEHYAVVVDGPDGTLERLNESEGEGTWASLDDSEALRGRITLKPRKLEEVEVHRFAFRSIPWGTGSSETSPSQAVPEAENPGAEVGGEEATVDLEATRIYFGHESAQLDREARSSLRVFVDHLKSDADVESVLVIGHADESEGEWAVTEAIGSRRSWAVVAFLVSQGVARDRLRSRSYGSARPQCAGDEECIPFNRRVQLVVADRGE